MAVTDLSGTWHKVSVDCQRAGDGSKRTKLKKSSWYGPSQVKEPSAIHVEIAPVRLGTSSTTETTGSGRFECGQKPIWLVHLEVVEPLQPRSTLISEMSPALGAEGEAVASDFLQIFRPC